MAARSEQLMFDSESNDNQELDNPPPTALPRRQWHVRLVIIASIAVVCGVSFGLTQRQVTPVQEDGAMQLSPADPKKLIEQAKLAEQAERYGDMVDAMKAYVTGGNAPSKEVRNLLSTAYKNVVGAKRSAWRVVDSIVEKSVGMDTVAKDYREVIKKELKAACKEVLDLLDNYLLKPVKAEGLDAVEGKVFLLKMKGDYLRYTVEVTNGDDRTAMANKAGAAYKDATDAARDLPPPNPTRLGLALNYAVYEKEIMHDGNKACDLAKKAFDDAIAELDHLKEDSYKDSTLIMQLLRDNLTLWTSEKDDH